MQKKIILLFMAAVLSCPAAVLPERIMSGYDGHFLGKPVEKSHVFRQIDILAKHKFNSIEVKFGQPLPAGERRMQVAKYRSDIEKIYKKARNGGLILQVCLYPYPRSRRNPAWSEHSQCPAVVAADGTVLETAFALNDIKTWRTIFEHAYQFAKLHTQVPFASLKFDIETIPFYYSYDDGSWERFAAANPGFPKDTPAARRNALLKERKAEKLYKSFFENEVEKAAKTFADDLHKLSPSLILGYMPASSGVMARIMETVLATDTVPAIIDGWQLYNGMGWHQQVADRAALARKRHKNNRCVTWLRPDNYSEKDLTIQAYHTGARMDGYSLWALWMLDPGQPSRTPKGISIEGHLKALQKANEALRADMADGTLKSHSRIAFQKVKPRVAALEYKDLKIPTLVPVGSGSMKVSLKKVTLREQQVILIYARSGEMIDVRLTHCGDRRRPMALHYAVLDQKKNVLRNESITYGNKEHFRIPAPHTGTYALVMNAGWGGMAWYQAEINTPYAAIYQYSNRPVYFFGRHKIFIAGKALGNPGFLFSCTPQESWTLTLDRGKPVVLRRPNKKTFPLPDKVAVQAVFGKAPFDWCQNLMLSFPDGKNPLIFLGPERTVKISE